MKNNIDGECSTSKMCMANILIERDGTKRQLNGAIIELQYHHLHDWRLTVYVCGREKYAHKVERNKVKRPKVDQYTGATIWVGEKDWSLEFNDKKDWEVFKDLHQECYTRNVAHVEEHQVPGVRVIENIAQRSQNDHFIQPSTYIHTLENEVERALNPKNNKILYDMDSEDEEWLDHVDTEHGIIINEDTFERAMYKFEKDTYLYQEHQMLPYYRLPPIPSNTSACKHIYCYWRHKRERKGKALVRNFQPSLWEQNKGLQAIQLTRLHLQHPSASMEKLRQSLGYRYQFAFSAPPPGLNVQPIPHMEKSLKSSKPKLCKQVRLTHNR